MAALVAGLVLFLGIHLLPSWPAARQRLLARLGEGPYKGAFSLISLLGLILIVVGKARAPYLHAYSPPTWGRHATMGLMALSALAFAAIYLPTNIKRWTAHPMMWGVLLWSVAHLLSNGDLASLLLFGGFAVFAPFDIWSSNRRGAQPALRERIPIRRDLLVIAVALALYSLLLFGHPYLFGVAVLRM